jgi:hypothetical protein
MWGGFGTGQLCSLCDKPIERYQLEYEIELGGATVQTFRFHTLCHSIWQFECAPRRLPEEASVACSNRQINPVRSA